MPASEEQFINQPRNVSVVVSTYKRPERLLRCIQSIISQSSIPMEIIVVHDGAGSETKIALDMAFPALLESGFIRFVETHAWFARPAPARNLGVKLSVGEFVAFCDDDDFWMPTKLELQLGVFTHNPGVGAVFAQYMAVTEQDDDGRVNDIKRAAMFDVVEGGRDGERICLRKLLSSGGLCHSSAVVRRQWLTGVLFPESRFERAFEDYGAWLRLAIDGCDIRMVQLPLVGYLANNAASIRGNRVTHNLRLCLFVTKELLVAGRLVELIFFYWGRYQAFTRRFKRERVSASE